MVIGPQRPLQAVDWRVYVIIDPRWVAGGIGLVDVARQALGGGAGVIQLRNKQADGRTLVDQSEAIQHLCADHDALFIVNDRLDVALAAGADGVHLGPGDIPVDRARRIAPELVIGASAGTAQRATALDAQGADYLGVGAIYDAHVSKADASAARGPRAIRSVTRRVDIPVVGIGGITAKNAAEVTEAGAAGVAVIRAVLASDQPQQATRRLLTSVSSRPPSRT